MIGDFAGFGTVWYYSDGIASVLSLGLVSNTMRITMDTAIGNALFVHRNDGTLRKFGKSNHGLEEPDNSYSIQHKINQIMGPTLT